MKKEHTLLIISFLGVLTMTVNIVILKKSREGFNFKRIVKTETSPHLPKRSRTSTTTPALKTTTRKSQIAVILISQFRSGSSIIGELFNRNFRHTTYFFEPLQPFGKADWMPVHSALKERSVKVVEDIARCKFRRLTKLYQSGLDFTQQEDKRG